MSDDLYAIWLEYCKSVVLNDIIYFQGREPYGTTSGNELWAYNTLNNSAWLAADINPWNSNSGNYGNPGYHFMISMAMKLFRQQGITMTVRMMCGVQYGKRNSMVSIRYDTTRNQWRQC